MNKLPKAPLQEVIFEIRWALTPNKDGQMVDEGFELASGRLSTIIENEFTFYRRIALLDISDYPIPYNVIHQYWASKDKWPVLQLGPGIFTINCTEEEYYWEGGFRQLIERACNWLMQSYKQTLSIQLASLKYIDAIKIDDYGGIGDGWQSFIRDNFNFDYNNYFGTRGKQKKIQINQTFELEDKSDLQLQITNGTIKNKLALVWQTAILKKDDFEAKSLFAWADYAHQIAHDLFKELVKPDLYASFSGKTEN